MNRLALIGRYTPGCLASPGRSGVFAAISIGHRARPLFYPRPIWRRLADDSLHPSEQMRAAWADNFVPPVEPAFLEEGTP